MRKGFALMISVFLIFSCTVSVCAAEAQYSTAGDLYEAWYNNLPDYICGVWSTDGGTTNLTFGIQNNASGNAGKQKILELIENDSSVTFVYQEFSRNYLLQIHNEIDEYFKLDQGLISSGLDDINNCIVLSIYQERKDNPDTQKMVNEITGKYGKAVSVEYTDQLIYTVGANEPNNTWLTLTKQQSMFMPMAMLLLLLFGVVFVISVRRKMLILQTNRGTTVATTLPPSAKDVEDMVKQSNYSVPSDLRQKVMDMIDREGE